MYVKMKKKREKEDESWPADLGREKIRI